MIQIKKQNIDSLVEYHLDNLGKSSKRFPLYFKYSFKSIITATPEKLDEIARWYLTLLPKQQEKFKYIRDYGYTNFAKKKKEYNAYDLAKSLNIDACPYCNRNYTFTVTKDKDEILRPDIDHFYDKGTYPILALSFFNLIPSCIECNRILKGTEKFDIKKHLHPYLDDFNSLAKFEYKYVVEKTDDINSKNKIDIKIKSSDKRAQNIIDDLNLETIYNVGYKDIVLELIQKREIYPDSYIDDLFHQYEGTLFKNREDVLRHITGGYIEDKDINKRPLSKLIKDISEELDLI